MMAGRRRPVRRPSAIERHLESWRDIVRTAERLHRQANPVLCTCDDHRDWEFSRAVNDPRAALERIIRRGGRDGRRVSRAVWDWDERYLAATEPLGIAVVDRSQWWTCRIPTSALMGDFLY